MKATGHKRGREVGRVTGGTHRAAHCIDSSEVGVSKWDQLECVYGKE